MALIKCDACGSEISNLDDNCFMCGASSICASSKRAVVKGKVSNHFSSPQEIKKLIIALIVGAVLIVMYIVSQN